MKNKKFEALFLLLVITTILVSSSSFAKYKSTYGLETSSMIASFVIKDTITDNLQLEVTEITPGITKEYTFTVQNFDISSRSDVDINYVLTIDNPYHVLPLEIELYNSNDLSVQLLNDNVMNNGYLDKSINQTDEYILKITLPTNAYEYQNLIDEVSIKVEAIQVD